MVREASHLRPIPDKSVDELEGYAPRSSVSTKLIDDVLAARKIPLAQLTPAQIRLLISQRQGTKYLVPFAFALLEKQPWIEADFYPGDLLALVARLDPGFWPPGKEWRNRFLELFKSALSIAPSLDEDTRNTTVEGEVRDAIARIGAPAA
jgi:hypothetical protein